jgi:hypothetical protein
MIRFFFSTLVAYSSHVLHIFRWDFTDFPKFKQSLHSEFFVLFDDIKSILLFISRHYMPQ